MKPKSSSHFSPLSCCLLVLLTTVIGIPTVGYVVLLGLPGMCNGLISRVCKEREAEGKFYVGVIGRVQQEYYRTHRHFTNSWEEIIQIIGSGLWIEASQAYSASYEYSIEAYPAEAFAYATPIGQHAKERGIGYVSGTFVVKTALGEETTATIVCQVKRGESVYSVVPMLQNGSPVCPP